MIKDVHFVDNSHVYGPKVSALRILFGLVLNGWCPCFPRHVPRGSRSYNSLLPHIHSFPFTVYCPLAVSPTTTSLRSRCHHYTPPYLQGYALTTVWETRIWSSRLRADFYLFTQWKGRAGRVTSHVSMPQTSVALC